MASNCLWGDADAPVPEPVKRECQVRRLVRGWRLDLAQHEAGDDVALLCIVTAAPDCESSSPLSFAALLFSLATRL
eukprot:3530979-Rhodomonas_salina.2